MRFMGWVVLGALLFAGTLAVEARLPEVGDDVFITVPGAMSVITYSGIITDVDENMITLNCTHIGKTYAGGSTDGNIIDPFDICIGKCSILSLTWPHTWT